MSEWIDEIRAMLDEARNMTAELPDLHDQALTDSSVRNKFKSRIKSILEHERSALDYLAVGIHE